LYQIASDRQATHPGRRVCEQNKGELRRRLAALFVTSCITRLRVRWSSMFRRSGARDATGTRQTASSCLTPPTLKSRRSGPQSSRRLASGAARKRAHRLDEGATRPYARDARVLGWSAGADLRSAAVGSRVGWPH
jgi:hypothetical protein